MEQNNFAVITEDLTRRFGDFIAVDRVNIRVPRGDIFGFLGPNGAGKTTTIRMLLGLITPSEGRATVLGFDTSRQTYEVQKRIGYMSQRFSLYHDLTVHENLDFYGSTYGLRGARLKERIAYALEMTELGDQRNELTSRLAGGFRQRLALACAILHDSQVLFLDEPTAGVDPISRRDFWNFLYELVEEGQTIFVTTHYMDEAENCRHLALIHNGQIILQGAPTTIKEEMVGKVLEIDCDQPEAAMRALREMDEDTIEEIALYGALIHVIAADAKAIQKPITQTFKGAGLTIRSMEMITPSLEDVFITSVRNHRITDT